MIIVIIDSSKLCDRIVVIIDSSRLCQESRDNCDN